MSGSCFGGKGRDSAGIEKPLAATMWLVVKTVQGVPMLVGIGEFTTHSRTDFSGDLDVHWGYDFGFDPWPLAQNRFGD